MNVLLAFLSLSRSSYFSSPFLEEMTSVTEGYDNEQCPKQLNSFCTLEKLFFHSVTSLGPIQMIPQDLQNSTKLKY